MIQPSAQNRSMIRDVLVQKCPHPDLRAYMAQNPGPYGLKGKHHV